MRCAWLAPLLLLLTACGEELPGGTDGGITEEGDGGFVDPGVDGDGDGLPDDFERAAARPELLDPGRMDTDGDGTADGQEDLDGDGLSNLEELALARLRSAPAGCTPSPLKKTLALELDAMVGRALPDAVLEVVQGAFAALPTPALDGSTGVQLCIYRDEEGIAAQDLPGDLGARSAFLEAHPPRFADRAAPRIPYAKMLHAVIVTRRTDIAARGGDTLPAGGVEGAGVLIYQDALQALHPACETAALAAITVEEALAGSLVHELGHTLQLGHDTEVGGGIEHHNIMSLQSSCTDAQMRSHGFMNQDPALGNTEAVHAPRFSHAAAALMRFEHKLSADTGDFEDDDGREM